jgi:hypothetical protein
MLYKMLAVEATYLENKDSFTRRPRQLFVTQSRVLAARVKEYYDSLALTLGKVKKGGPGNESEPETVKNRGDDVLLAGGMDDDGLPHRLPRRFDELEEKDFPLFLSFDQVSTSFASRTIQPTNCSVAMQAVREPVQAQFRWRIHFVTRNRSGLPLSLRHRHSGRSGIVLKYKRHL